MDIGPTASPISKEPQHKAISWPSISSRVRPDAALQVCRSHWEFLQSFRSSKNKGADCAAPWNLKDVQMLKEGI
jgi:hypothetical protein